MSAKKGKMLKWSTIRVGDVLVALWSDDVLLVLDVKRSPEGNVDVTMLDLHRTHRGVNVWVASRVPNHAIAYELLRASERA